MSELTISSFNPQISWPYPGATATLRYQYSADFVDSDGQPVLRSLPKDVPCTVADGVLSVPSHTLITTNDAVVNPLVTLSARFLDARNTPRTWLFQNFSIPESLTPTTTIGDLEIYNQGSSLVLPPDAYLNRDEVIALIATRLPNTVLASDVLLGLTLLSVPAANPLIPRVVGDNDPRVPTTLTAAGQALLDDASASAQLTTLGVTAAGKALLDDPNAAAQLVTLGLTATAAEINKLDGAGSIVASGTQHAHVADPTGGSVIDVEARAVLALVLDALEAFQINAP